MLVMQIVQGGAGADYLSERKRQRSTAEVGESSSAAGRGNAGSLDILHEVLARSESLSSEAMAATYGSDVNEGEIRPKRSHHGDDIPR